MLRIRGYTTFVRTLDYQSGAGYLHVNVFPRGNLAQTIPKLGPVPGHGAVCAGDKRSRELPVAARRRRRIKRRATRSAMAANQLPHLARS